MRTLGWLGGGGDTAESCDQATLSSLPAAVWWNMQIIVSRAHLAASEAHSRKIMGISRRKVSFKT